MKGTGKENTQKETGAKEEVGARYKIIPVIGADMIYDSLTNTYYKQYRLPFPEGANG